MKFDAMYGPLVAVAARLGLLGVVALAGCEAGEHAHAAADATSADTAAVVALDAADASADSGPDAEPAADVAGCTPVQIAACDDKNPCTTDGCDATGCLHAPATAPCDDSNPCTQGDHCDGAVCKGTGDVCDDHDPCTIDACQLGGKCSHVHNMHEDCLPLITVAQPPRGLRLSGPAKEVTVAGKIVAQNSKPTLLTVQGQPVAMAADGTFEVKIALAPGAQALVLKATDQLGGERLQVQGIHYAAQWIPADMPVVAGGFGIGIDAAAQTKGALAGAWLAALNPLLAESGFTVARPFGASAVAVKLGLLAAAPSVPIALPGLALALSAAPTATGVALPWPATGVADLGNPQSPECSGALLQLGLKPDVSGVQATVSRDLLNAALRAAWLGGAQSGDVSPLAASIPAPAGVTFVLEAQPLMPWLLQGCNDGEASLRLLDFQVHLRAFLGNPPSQLVEASIHVAVTAKPVLKLENGKLQLWLGPTQEILAESMTDTMAGTDAHKLFSQVATSSALPALLAEWAKAPLVEVALPQGLTVGGAAVGWTAAGAPAWDHGWAWWSSSVVK